MWGALVLIYTFATIFVGAFLFAAVERIEPNPRLAVIFKIAIIAAGIAAIANQVLPGGLLADIAQFTQE
jgi:hypothetical protein